MVYSVYNRERFEERIFQEACLNLSDLNTDCAPRIKNCDYNLNLCAPAALVAYSGRNGETRENDIPLTPQPLFIMAVKNASDYLFNEAVPRDVGGGRSFEGHNEGRFLPFTLAKAAGVPLLLVAFWAEEHNARCCCPLCGDQHADSKENNKLRAYERITNLATAWLYPRTEKEFSERFTSFKAFADWQYNLRLKLTALYESKAPQRKAVYDLREEALLPELCATLGLPDDEPYDGDSDPAETSKIAGRASGFRYSA